jgi:hypothetical protein
MKTLLIKILFWLLKVNESTKNLVLYEDLRRLKPIESEELIKQIQFKYNKALSVALSIPHFMEWLYLQTVIKQREHLLTIDKDKRNHQRATVLFILWMIEEMKRADQALKKLK